MTQAILFLFALLIVNSQGQENKSLTCSFVREDIWFQGSLQTCEIKNQQIDQEGFVVSGSPDSSVEGFHIQHNKDVKFIPEKLAEKLPDLIAIQIWNCSVRQVRRTHFQGLNKLKALALVYNEIADVESESFDDLHQLEELSLSNNNISHLHRDLFRSLANLKLLWLDDNQIESIGPTIFSSLTNVQDINLASNKIGSLAANQFENLVNLEKLSLAGNNLEEIDENLLNTNLKLEYIWFNDNKLRFIPSETFYGPEKLSRVNLRGNQCIDDDWWSPDKNDLKNALAENCSKLF